MEAKRFTERTRTLLDRAEELIAEGMPPDDAGEFVYLSHLEKQADIKLSDGELKKLQGFKNRYAEILSL